MHSPKSLGKQKTKIAKGLRGARCNRYVRIANERPTGVSVCLLDLMIYRHNSPANVANPFSYFTVQ